MTNLRKTWKIAGISMLFLLLGLVFSCEETEMKEKITPAVTESDKRVSEQEVFSKISFNGKYLTFPNTQTFEEAIALLRDKPYNEIKSFEEQFGFTSLRTIYEKSLEEEEKWIESRNNSKPTSDSKVFGLKSKYAKLHKKSLIVHDNEFIRMNIFDHAFATFLNEKGLVRIGTHLLQYTDEYIKLIKKGKEDKVELLDATVSSDEKNGIMVFPVTKQKIGNTESNSNMRYTYSASGEDVIGGLYKNYRMKVNISLSNYTQPIIECLDGYDPSTCTSIYRDECDGCEVVGTRYLSSYTACLSTDRRSVSPLQFWWNADRSSACKIQVTFTSKRYDQQTITTRTVSITPTQDVANLYLTIYNHNMINVTSATHEFWGQWAPSGDAQYLFTDNLRCIHYHTDTYYVMYCPNNAQPVRYNEKWQPYVKIAF